MKHIDKVVDYKTLNISTPAFKANEMIPARYTCDGLNVNPMLDIQNIPVNAKSLALIVEDPDAPAGTWVHWIVWNVPVTHHIKENAVHGIEGLNDFQQHRYGGPCPPGGVHRYFFKVYALDALLQLAPDTKKQELERAMSDHIVGFGELVGLYESKKIAGNNK